VLDDEDVELADLRPRASRRRAAQRGRTPGGVPTLPRGQPRPIGEELRVAVLFTDLRGFTTFTQALLPYDVIHELQRHLHQVTRAVQRHDGVVTSYMGDGVMALFVPAMDRRRAYVRHGPGSRCSCKPTAGAASSTSSTGAPSTSTSGCIAARRLSARSGAAHHC
jgi:class 3 adenylate cyclase